MRSISLRLLPAVALMVVAAVFYASGAAEDLTPAGLAAHGQAWRLAAARHPLEAISLYLGAFALLAAAGLPVAMVLTLAGGMLFGPVFGGVAAAAGAGLAALVGYTAVRSLFGPRIVVRLGRRWPRLARGIEGLRGGGFWPVVGARLLPVMPFAAVNVAAGAARLPVGVFLSASVLGGLPSAFVFAGLGSGLLGELSTKNLIAAGRSPQVWGPLLGLSLLTVVPVLVARRRTRGANRLADGDARSA